jgi:hypothetical protein
MERAFVRGEPFAFMDDKETRWLSVDKRKFYASEPPGTINIYYLPLDGQRT